MDEKDIHQDRETRRVEPMNVSNWKVLIVDDQFDNVMVAEAALDFHGAEVRSAEDGIKGLDALETFQPTLILLDLSMPNMNGWEMFNKVREQSQYDHVAIIALTAHAMQGDEQKVMDAGFTGYIPKPFSVSTLVSDIQAILETDSGESPPLTQES